MNTKSENRIISSSYPIGKGKPLNRVKIENYVCPYCDMRRDTILKYVAVRHEKICKKNPNHIEVKGHKHNEEAKKRISEGRKRFLAEHPEVHPWKKHSRFVSVPCEEFKAYLKEKGYTFEEEVEVVPNRHFSVDICFPDLMLVFEINGNQHYGDDMELLPYYQERHDLIEFLGWKVIEVPYNQSYNEEFRLRVCRQLDAKLSSKQSSESVWEFESPHPYIKTLKERKAKVEEEKLRKQEERKSSWNDELNRRKELILNSGIDITKFGWVGKVVEVTGLSKHQVEDCVNFFNIPSFKRGLKNNG